MSGTAEALRAAHHASAPPAADDEAPAELRLELIGAEREEAIRFRKEGRNDDEVMRDHERCLDLRSVLVAEESHVTERHAGKRDGKRS
ncbi:hypothetical protein ABZZ46_33240 [Streptomyces rochei]|uniref:hypothetical protein n=1 Tax=Streptomyces rochei TaxID=1928 RepID=UPI0033B14963